MNEIEEIHPEYMPDVTFEPDGYDMTRVPTNHPRNIMVIIEKLNEIIRAYNNDGKDT